MLFRSIFSKGGGERTARQFGIDFLGTVELDPAIRKGGDSGHPVALLGEGVEGAKSLFVLAQRVKERALEVAARQENVIEIK